MSIYDIPEPLLEEYYEYVDSVEKQDNKEPE